MWPTHLPFLVFFATVSNSSAATFQQGSSRGHGVSISAAAHSGSARDDNHLIQPIVDLVPSLDSALQTIRKLEAMPTCSRVASAALIDSCATVEAPSSPGQDSIYLEATKSIYAARLAMCELAEARVAKPQECKAFVPTERQAKKPGFRGLFTPSGPTQPISHYPQYEELTEQHLYICLGALESKPQWWTSYSNARQNAVHICQAMRFDVERDEQIETFRRLTEVTNDVTDASNMSAQQAQAARNALRELRMNLYQFQLEFYEGQKEKQAEIERFWLSHLEHIRADVDSISDHTGKITSDLSQAAESIQDNTDRTNEAFELLSQILIEAAQIQRAEATSLSEQTHSLAAKLQDAQSTFLDGWVSGLYDVKQSIELSIALVDANHEALRQQGRAMVEVTDKVVGLNSALIVVESAAQELRNMQLEWEFETRVSHNHTRKNLEQLKLMVDAANSAVGGLQKSVQSILTNLVAHIWKAARFPLHYFMFATFAFAFCSRLCHLPSFTAVVWAIILGLVAAFTAAFTGGPIDVLERWYSAGPSDAEIWTLISMCTVITAAFLFHAGPNLYRRI